MKKIFIDGQAGTTGLRIRERLMARSDIELLSLSEETRKLPEYRKKMLNEADIVFLCLPDDAAREAVAMVENPDVVILDTSTAHRTNPDWTYGFPEISKEIAQGLPAARRVAVPGCHASGFIALVRPLVDAGILSADVKLTCHSITGYSGGGKKMIAQYEEEGCSPLLGAPRQYALTQGHKHLKEMKAITGLTYEPIFCPIVADFYSGMEVTVPLFVSDLQNGATVADIKRVYADMYQGPMVTYTESDDGDGMLSAAALSGKDSMEIAVFGNEDRILLTARYDNLGKGASGAAVECLNVILGTTLTEGLDI